MLRPKHHLYLYVVSAQKSHELFSDYFPTTYAFQALILLNVINLKAEDIYSEMD